MSVNIADLVARIRYTLFDPSPGIDWTDDELISYLNGASSQLLALRPDANPVVETMSLSPGSHQQIPDDGVVFIDAIHSGNKATVTVQSLHEYTRTTPDWPQGDADTTSIVLFDPRSPRDFHVVPPADSGRAIQIVYSAMAPRLTSVAGTLGVPDWWETSLWAAVCGMALMKNGPRYDAGKAMEFIKMFKDSVASSNVTHPAAAASDNLSGKM